MSTYAPFRFLIAAAAALLVATMIASSSAHAMLLGDAVAQSALGAPLRVVIPIKPARGESLEAACFRLVPTAAGAAPIVTARVSLERAAATPRLVVTTPGAISEPAIQFTIQAGCDGTTRRNYVLLLDPPAAGAAAAIRPITAREPGQERSKTAPSAVRRSADISPQGESRAAQPRAVAMDRGSDTTAVVVAPGGRDSAASVASPAAFEPVAASVEPGRLAPAAAPRARPVETQDWGNLWWYLAALLVASSAITLGTFFVRSRAAPQVPEWTRGAAYSGPRSFTDMSAAPATLSHTDETLPSISSGTKPRSVAPSQFTVEATVPPGFARRTPAPDISTLDTLISDMPDADVVEERAVRQAWAAARSDVEREADGNAILRAIEAAERDLLFAPPPPVQGAMDRSLDDDLLEALPRRQNKAAA